MRRMPILLILLTASCVVSTSPTAARELDVAQIEICRDVDRESREPLGVADVFPTAIERLYCFTRLTGAADTTGITHVWFHEDRTRGKVPLAVRSPDWRTWSSKTMLPRWTGEWEVRVLDRDGLVLGTKMFRLSDAPTTEEGP